MILAGDALVAGTAAATRYRRTEDLPRGQFFSREGRRGSLRTYDDVVGELPRPWFTARPEYEDCYHTCVRLLFAHQHEPAPASGLRSNYLDAAFNDNIFLWDTAFIVMFARAFEPWLPAAASLDNFYARQYPDGEICREFSRRSGESLPWWVNLAGGPLYSFFHRDYGFRRLGLKAPTIDVERTWHPDLGRVPSSPPLLTLDALNNPVLAWAELEAFRQTGDTGRVIDVLTPLAAYFWAFDEQTRHASGLYVTDWASMDNSPRNERLYLGVDTASQMALFADNLLALAAIAESDGAEVPIDRLKLQERRDELCALVNELMWDQNSQFYVDLDAAGESVGVRTVAGFWPLVAGIAPTDRAAALCRALADPSAFARPHRVPTVAADEPGYVAEGGYWRGGVWAPINQMVVAGLDRIGEHTLASEIARNHVEALARIHSTERTVFEYYSPERFDPGNNDHRDFVGWSGLGPIGFFATHVIGIRGDAGERRITWRLPTEPSTCGIERYWIAGSSVDLEARPAEPGWVVTATGGEGLELCVIEPSGATAHARLGGRVELRLTP